MKNPRTSKDFIDHIFKYDPEVISTASQFSSPQPELMAPRNLTPIPWPHDLAPKPKLLKPKPDPESLLPECDYLIVTWTVAEALALSDILTPGYRSKTDWYLYTHRFHSHYKKILRGGAPSLKSKRLGSWFITEINQKSVLCFKSELHMARDGSKLPVKDLWLQLIKEVRPKLVITTGTAGAIGESVMLGDVVVTKKVRFDCNRTFKKSPFNNKQYISRATINTSQFSIANYKLLKVNAGKLPHSSRTPEIIYKTSGLIKQTYVVTTDFFAYDNTTNTFRLQSLGAVVEMGDAVLGLVCSRLGKIAPDWLAVRNASDPQIDGTLSKKEQIQMASRIYEKYGYWTTVESAIACWAVIA
jgi:nucleoside phosphorylase